MPTLTEVLAATKSSPRSAIRFTPGTFPGTGTLVIEDRRSSTSYAVTDIPTEWAGTAARFTKLTAGTDPEASAYDVFVGKPADSCECKGFYRHGHCRHVSALKALVDNGWLSRAELANPEADVSNTEAEELPSRAELDRRARELGWLAPRPAWVPSHPADLQGGF